MKIFTGTILGLCLISSAQWPQSHFIIGAFGDPALTGEPGAAGITKDETMLSNYRSAGFNTLLGFTNSSTSNANGWYSLWGYGTVNNPCITYRLDRMAAVGGLSSFFLEERVVVGPLSQTLTDISGLPAGAAVRGGTTISLQFQGLSSTRRGLQLGYLLIPDEPDQNQIDNVIGPMQANFSAYDPGMASIVALRAKWDKSWADYSTYLDHYINLPSTKIVYYDYYLFEKNLSNATNGYFTLGDASGQVYYFRNLNMVASKVKDARSVGKDIAMWGFGGWVEHTVAGDYRHLANLDEKMLGYVSYAQLLYGAKGVLFYGYDFEHYSYDNAGNVSETHFNSPSPANSFYNPANFTTVQTINNRLNTLGSALLGYNWYRTVHGKSTDPSSLEPGLDVIDSNTPFYYLSAASDALQPGDGTDSHWSKDSLAIGLFRKGAMNCMLILNKSVYLSTAGFGTGYNNINKTKYFLKSRLVPKKLNKTTGLWENITSQYDPTKGSQGTTYFDVSVSPGDAELVWLYNPGAVLPTIYPLIL